MDYLKSVEDAVNKFYSMGSKDAHKWLLQFQSSPEAWAHVWPLLDPSKVRIFFFFSQISNKFKSTKLIDDKLLYF